jgi:hypothetical protein
MVRGAVGCPAPSDRAFLTSLNTYVSHVITRACNGSITCGQPWKVKAITSLGITFPDLRNTRGFLGAR